MRHQTTSRIVAVISAAAVLGLPPAASRPAAAGPAATGSAVGDTTVAALVAAAGSVAVADDSGTTNCMTGPTPEPVAYRNDRIVLRTWLAPAAAADKVRTALRDVGSAAEITGAEQVAMHDLPGAETVTPVVYVSFAPPAGEPVPIVALARRLRQYPISASPDYLLANASGPSEFWPGGPPNPTTVPPPSRTPTLGSGVTVVVYDTGLPDPSETNNPPNVTPLTPMDGEAVDAREPFGEADHPWTGHTTVISSVLASLVPGAAVKAARITDSTGVATDLLAARRMANTLRQADQVHSWPDLIVNAFGSPACDVGPTQPGADMPPLGLQMVAEAVDRHGEALVLASAGNRATSRPHYPAAFPPVLGVGALDTTVDGDGSAWTAASRTGPRASFSNFGAWVDIWASGVRLEANHVEGLRFVPGGPVIDGLAEVDGTSYAVAYAGGLIAEQMAATGQSAGSAWTALAASGVPCSPHNGSGIAITLAALAAAATTEPAPGLPTAC